MGPMGASCRKPRLRFRSTVLVPYALEEGTWGVQPVPETLEDQSWYLPHAYIRNLSLEFDSNLYRWQPLHSTFSSSFQVFLPPLLATMAHFPTLPPWPLPADRKRLCRLKALASWYHACAYALRHTWRCCALEAHRQAGMWAAGLDFFGTPSNTSCFKARWGWWPSQVGIRRSSSPASKYLKVSIMIYIYIYIIMETLRYFKLWYKYIDLDVCTLMNTASSCSCRIGSIYRLPQCPHPGTIEL